MRWPWRVALVASALTGTLVVAAAVLALAAPSPTTVALAVAGGGIALVAAALGSLVARHSPASRWVGPLLALFGLTVAVTAAREIWFVLLAARPDDLERLPWLVALLRESSVWLLVVGVLLLLYFPDGRLPGPRWRAVPTLLVAAGLGHQAWGAVDPAPFRPPLEELAHPFQAPGAAVEALSLVAFATVLAGLVAGPLALLVRYRRSDPTTRAQVRWLALAGLGLPAFVAVCGGEILVGGQPGPMSLVVGVATAVGVPLAVAVAVLHHDLYDVDKALAATVSYAALTAVLVGVFGVASFTAGVVLGGGSSAVAAAATAVMAVGLAPLRSRLQRAVSRRLSPPRQAALAAVEELTGRIHADEARPEQLEGALRTALGDPDLRVAYRLPGSTRLVDGAGNPVDAPDAVPVTVAGAEVGALVTGSRRVPRALLAEVAQACATLVEVVRLRLELAGALELVRASRARLVQAAAEERHRLERDLHDGAQQRLVSLGLALRLAQRHLDDGTVELHGLLDQTVAELGTVVAELRQIANGLRPSSLDDGLLAALGAATQHLPVPVALDVAVDVLPEDVATTVYYVASEAIANAVKYAGATRIDVQVARRSGHVEVRVADDGCGGATMRPSSGLSGLTDRVNALGGRLSLHSPVGRGTTVKAALPCAS